MHANVKENLSVLVGGPYLVRGAVVSGSTLALVRILHFLLEALINIAHRPET